MLLAIYTCLFQGLILGLFLCYTWRFNWTAFAAKGVSTFTEKAPEGIITPTNENSGAATLMSTTTDTGLPNNESTTTVDVIPVGLPKEEVIDSPPQTDDHVQVGDSPPEPPASPPNDIQN
jgi:hypothetical protein